jgi:predicted ribosomally synthesized peptide with nif11-like leader
MTVDALLKDRAFAQKLADAQDMDAVVKMFAEEGVTVTPDELMQRTLPQGDELTENDLEDVAGGSMIFNPFIGCLRKLLGFSGGGGGHRF